MNRPVEEIPMRRNLSDRPIRGRSMVVDRPPLGRSIAIMILALLVLGLAMPAAAQKKQKDPVLHQYLIEEFAQLNAKLDRLGERLVALEAELARMKQTESELMTEVRSTQTTVKTMDTALSTF